MTNDSIFRYNETFYGGTEIMARGFIANILPEMKNIQKYHCVILPGNFPDLRTWGTDGKETILWIHNTISQFRPELKQVLQNKLIKNSIKYIVSVSEYAKKEIAKDLDFDLNKIIVIPNAINSIIPVSQKFEDINKVKLIHASNKDRGLDILLKAIPLVDEDFEINIFNNFYPDLPHGFDPKVIDDPRINFYGQTPRKTVYRFMAEAHVHAYPSIYAETSCLTQMEALSAGCYSVHTDLGALPETSMGHGTMIPFADLTPERYAEELTKAIRSIKTNGYDYSKQKADIDATFSWQKAKENWLKFDESI